MKVVLLIRELQVGGTETQVLTLARGLHAQNVAVKVAVFYGGGVIEKELAKSGVEVIDLRKNSRWRFSRFFLQWFKFLRSYKPDVIYSFLTEANLVATLAKLVVPKTKVIWGIRAATSDADLRENDFFVKVCFEVAKRLSGIPSRIITNSQSSKDYHVLNGFQEDKFEVVVNGVDSSIFTQDPQNGDKLKEKLHLRLDSRVIGIVGRLDPIKNHEMFFLSASQIVREFTDVWFLVVGNGDQRRRDYLEGLTAELGIEDRVLWMTGVRNIEQVYNALTINTLCSHSESFPNAVIESLSCGVPCVVTDVGDCAAIVDDKLAVVEKNNPEDLVIAWRRILQMEPDVLLARSFKYSQRMQSEFNNEVMLKRTKSLFEYSLESIY